MWFTSHCASARLVLFSFTNRKHDDVAFNDRPAALLLPLRDASLCIHGRSLEQPLSARLASDENMWLEQGVEQAVTALVTPSAPPQPLTKHTTRP